jgi:lysophospholipase L1-like esterase
MQPTRNPSVKSAYQSKTVAVLGDSLSDNLGMYGVRPSLMWPELTAAALRTANLPYKARNLGKAGDTSTQMLARVAGLTYHEIPDAVFVAAGVNDPVNSISNAVTQSNIAAIGQYLIAAGVPATRIGIVSAPYLNFASGGDTLATPYASYVGVRGAQAAAAAALGAGYIDFYNFLRNLIVAGTETQGSNSWHAIAGNQHLNALGNSYCAQAVQLGATYAGLT